MPALDGRRVALRAVAEVGHEHAGLWLDKFLPVLAPEKPEEKDAIRDLIKNATRIRVVEGYREAAERRERALRSLDGGIEGGETRMWTAEAAGRLVIGIGAQSVRETNLSLLHTWGVPYLPGSALKGLAAAAAHRYGAAEAWRKETKDSPQSEDHKLLFGDTTSAGMVVFHDAWWVKEGDTVPLDLDTMTVHHPNYYSSQPDAPADWDEPTPIAFATARGKYRVALSGPRAWVERAAEWLEIGLSQDGIGAKTAAGYGRMRLTPFVSEEERRWSHLLNFAPQHRGAGTAGQHVRELREVHAKQAPESILREAVLLLYRRDPSFWNGWLPRRSDEERAFLRSLGMVAPAKAGGEKVPVVAKAAEPRAEVELEWEPAMGWIAKDGGRVYVYAEHQGRRIEKELKDVTLTAETRTALEGGGATAPVSIFVQLQRSANRKKLRAVKLR